METTAKKNNIWGIVLGVVAIVLIIAAIVWATGEPTPITETNEENKSGEVYIGFTDATADIKNVNEINMEVEKVEIYSKTEGWVTVAEDVKAFNLLALKNSAKTEFYAKADVNAGIYERVRITLGDVTVKTKTNGDVKAYIPGYYVLLNMDVNVVADAATNVALDVLADKSLHMASSNKYIFAPVIRGQSTPNAQVAISGSNEVMATGGTPGPMATVGVDLSGVSRTNFNLNSQNNLRVDDSQGAIKFILDGQTFVQSSASQDSAIDASVRNQNQIETGTQQNNSTIDLNGGLNGTVDVNSQ